MACIDRTQPQIVELKLKNADSKLQIVDSELQNLDLKLQNFESKLRMIELKLQNTDSKLQDHVRMAGQTSHQGSASAERNNPNTPRGSRGLPCLQRRGPDSRRFRATGQVRASGRPRHLAAALARCYPVVVPSQLSEDQLPDEGYWQAPEKQTGEPESRIGHSQQFPHFWSLSCTNPAAASRFATSSQLTTFHQAAM